MSDNKNIKFEKGLEDLEKIVRDLENGELNLEDALKRYEDGIKLSRTLQGKLTEASKKIEVLTKNLEGNLEAKPLEAEKSGKAETKKKRAPKTNEEDLLI
jgi:exodeoxyribonuclease VII small subunit